MISDRLLRKWRKEALISNNIYITCESRELGHIKTEISLSEIKESNGRILRLTQELLDQHLVNKEGK